MTEYCVTAANHNNANDERASEFELWEWIQSEETKGWRRLGRKSLSHVADLLAQGNEVISGNVVKKEGKIDAYLMRISNRT